MTKKFLFSSSSAGVLISVFAHVATAGGAYLWFVVRQPSAIVAELDLSMTPLSPQIPNAGGGSGAKQPEKWVLPANKKAAPLPQVPVKVETKEEVQKQEARTALCEGNCGEGPLVGQGWGGGSGEGEGPYVPVQDTFRKPRWVKNFITTRDYPAVARQQGKDGRVVLTVLIDAEGHVRDARLLQGSYEIFNEVALRKIKEAEFSPAYDEHMKPVSCKVTLPIRFELR